MPEGDTVHHAAGRIRAVLEQRVPEEIRAPQPRHRADRWPERLAGRAVRAVDAHEEALAVVAFAREHMRQSARDGFIARSSSVYRRAGRPCPRCGAPIRQKGQWEDNRLTFWCPACQS